jgi:hypothetical protein
VDAFEQLVTEILSMDGYRDAATECAASRAVVQEVELMLSVSIKCSQIYVPRSTSELVVL